MMPFKAPEPPHHSIQLDEALVEKELPWTLPFKSKPLINSKPLIQTKK
jgi:hypothetical protein